MAKRKANCYPFCDIYTQQTFHMAQCEQDWEIYQYSKYFGGEAYGLAMVRELFGRRSKVTR